MRKDKKEKVLLEKLEKVEEYITRNKRYRNNRTGEPNKSNKMKFSFERNKMKSGDIGLGVYIYNYEVDDTIIVSSTGDKYYK